MYSDLTSLGALLLLGVFLVSLCVCVYVYFGYPALLFLLSRLRPRAMARGPATPSLTVIVPVFNEEMIIETKIRNTLELDYPPELLEVLVVSDGSTDATEEIARRFADARVRLLRRPRQGKASALNAGADAANGEVLVMTDANTTLEAGSLRAIAACLADPEVGGVCGVKKLLVSAEADTTEQGEGLYWRYENWQKGLESRIGSVYAADGSLYAVRRELFVPIEDPAQADDIAISTRVVLQGRRLAFEPRAVAYEAAPEEGREEFRRKVRVTNHSVRALLSLGRVLWRSGFYSVELLSHKLLRHLVPFFLIPLIASSLALAPAHPALLGLLAAQVGVYGLAVVGFALRRTTIGRSPLLAIPYFFCLVNSAALVGVLSIVAGHRQRSWRPRGGVDSAGG